MSLKTESLKDFGFFLAIGVGFVLLLALIYLLVYYQPNSIREKYKKFYGIDNISRVDTININGENHEFITIKENYYERFSKKETIHSPKCWCKQPFFIKYPVENEK